jgi:hypothetical protein
MYHTLATTEAVTIFKRYRIKKIEVVDLYDPDAPATNNQVSLTFQYRTGVTWLDLDMREFTAFASQVAPGTITYVPRGLMGAWNPDYDIFVKPGNRTYIDITWEAVLCDGPIGATTLVGSGFPANQLVTNTFNSNLTVVGRIGHNFS